MSIDVTRSEINANKFNSQICTTKIQSEHLLTLGLKKETADCILVEDAFKKDNYLIFPVADIDETLENEMSSEPIPAWSLHRLLCLLPTEYIYDIDFQRIMQDFIFRPQDMYEEAIGCIETLIEAGYFYEEYLEE